MPGARLLAVCVGRPRLAQTAAGRTVKTAIWKRPVQGRVRADGVNLAGDDQADRSVHGGPDKAVYAYASEDTAFWEDVLGRDLGAGALGENLWTRGIDVTNARLGERWAIGSALFEVAQPRLPCFKLGMRMEDPFFPKRFGQAARPGAYLRILEPGELGAGDAIEIVHRPDHGVTLAAFSDAALKDRSAVAGILALGDDVLSPGVREFLESLVRRTA